MAHHQAVLLINSQGLYRLPGIALKEALKKIEGTDLEKFLRQYNAI